MRRPPRVAKGKEVVSYETLQNGFCGGGDAGGDGGDCRPAMARHDNDGWWDNCDWVIVGWYWIPAVWGWDWSWAVVCVPDGQLAGHDDWRGDDDDDDDWWRHDGRW
jgi:hypothetical protein